jgi:riboflavin kinase
VKGKLVSGEGVGRFFVGVDWSKEQIREKLGFDPYQGTLNIRLSEREAEKLRKVLKASKGIEIVPAKGYFTGHCFKALIMAKIKGAIIIPDKPGYLSTNLEIIAPVYLRGTLSLEDDDEIQVEAFFNEEY